MTRQKLELWLFPPQKKVIIEHEPFNNKQVIIIGLLMTTLYIIARLLTN